MMTVMVTSIHPMHSQLTLQNGQILILMELVIMQILMMMVTVYQMQTMTSL